jgi:hypothetical protein
MEWKLLQRGPGGGCQLLKHRNTRHAGRTGTEAVRRVALGNAAEREHGDAHLRSQPGETLETHRWMRFVFRGAEKHGAQHSEVGAILFGLQQLLFTMAGNADEKMRGRDGADAAHLERTGRQMDTGRASRDGDIGSRVHQHPAAVGVRQGEHALHQRQEFAARHVFLANLHEIHAVDQAAGNGLDERFDAAGQMTIGNVVADHGSGMTS